MGVRGELFSARVKSRNDRRTYFFNIKENRTQDLFLTIVESKKKEGSEEFERHQIVVFENDLELFEEGLETVLQFVKENRRNRSTHASGKPRRPRPEV
jgi:hypothetical protein